MAANQQTLIDSNRTHRTCMQFAVALRSAIAPMPGGRLTLRAADQEQAHRQANHVGKERYRVGSRRKQVRTERQQGDECGKHQPALPCARWTPSPAIAFGGEPGFGFCFHRGIRLDSLCHIEIWKWVHSTSPWQRVFRRMETSFAMMIPDSIDAAGAPCIGSSSKIHSASWCS